MVPTVESATSWEFFDIPSRVSRQVSYIFTQRMEEMFATSTGTPSFAQSRPILTSSRIDPLTASFGQRRV